MLNVALLEFEFNHIIKQKICYNIYILDIKKVFNRNMWYVKYII